MEQLTVDNDLLRALREGTAGLPDDLQRLHALVVLIGDLLAEKADECEPSIEFAEAMAAEVETLFSLERAAAEKASMVPARCLGSILTKLAIWNALTSDEESRTGESDRDRLVTSLCDDIRSLARPSGKSGPTLQS